MCGTENNKDVPDVGQEPEASFLLVLPGREAAAETEPGFKNAAAAGLLI